MSINPKKEVWICYRGCGSGNLKQLWEKLNVVPDYDDEEELQLSLDIKLETPEPLPEGLRPARRVPEAAAFLQKRGVRRLKMVCNTLGLRSDGVSLYYPVYSIHSGHYHGYLKQDLSGGKPINYSSKDDIYGLWRYIGDNKGVTDTDILVIVEGPGDVIACLGAGVKWTGALMGTSMSESQITQAMAFDNICLFLDSDIPGRKGTLKIADKFFGMGINVMTVDWKNEYHRDPGDLQGFEIWRYLKSAIPAVCLDKSFIEQGLI